MSAALPIAHPTLIPVLSEDGDYTDRQVKWHPTHDQIRAFGGKPPEFYSEDEGGLFLFRDRRGQPLRMGPLEGHRFKLYQPTWQVMYWSSSGGVESREDVERRLTGGPTLAGEIEVGAAAEDRVVLIKETNARFWDSTGYKPGEKLDMAVPRDREMAKVWLKIFAEVRGHRDRATALALKTYEQEAAKLDARPPFLFVGEKPDGALHELWFPQRGELDVQYTTAVNQPEQYAYIAAFDFTKSLRGPVFDQFPASIATRSVSDAAEAALAAFREHAKTAAQGAAANILGVVRSLEGSWITPAFATITEAAAWLDRVGAQPTWFVYAAYFDKAGSMWPFPMAEAIGQAGATGAAPQPVGAWY